MHATGLAIACLLCLGVGLGVRPTAAIGGPAALRFGPPDLRLLLLDGATQGSLHSRATERTADAAPDRHRSNAPPIQRMRGGGDNVKCQFEVRVENTMPGDSVVVLGSGPALHNWDKSKATALTTTPDAFPWWWTEVPIPCGDSIEFKFAIRSADGSLTWEPGVNRKAVVPDDISHVFTCNYGDRTTPAPRGAPTEASAVESKPGFLQGAVKAANSLMSPRKTTRTGSPPPPEASSADPSTPENPLAASEPAQRTELPAEKLAPELQKTAPVPAMPKPGTTAAASASTVPAAAATASTVPAAAATTDSAAPAAAAKNTTALRFRTSLKRTPALYSHALLAVVQGTEVASAGGENSTVRTPIWRSLLVNMLRVVSAPVTLPIWTVYKVVGTALRILSRVYASLHSILFEADPAKFERTLISNIFKMQDSMNSMNTSLHCAINTVDKQMGDVARLEQLWQIEHQKYTTAVQERKKIETEYQQAAREFRQDLLLAKKAAADAEAAHAEQLRMAREETQRLIAELTAASESNAARLEAAIGDGKRDLRTLARKLEEVGDSGAKAHDGIEGLRRQSASIEVEVGGVKEQMHILGVELNVSRAETALLQSKITATGSELQEASREMARFGAEVRVSRAEAELLQQKMSATEAVVTKFNGDLELLQARVHQHLSKVQGSTAEPAAARASDAKRPSLAQIMTGKSKSAGSSPASVKFTLKKASELMGGEEDEETVTRGHEHGDTASGKLEKTASFVSEGDSGYHESPGSARGKAAPPRHADVKHSRLRPATSPQAAGAGATSDDVPRDSETHDHTTAPDPPIPAAKRLAFAI